MSTAGGFDAGGFDARWARRVSYEYLSRYDT